MIKIEITKSSQLELISEYTFHKNLIYIGNNDSADLYFKDATLFNNHLFIEIIGDKIIVHPHKKLEYFLIDGKRTTSMRYLKVNQIVSFGLHELKVIQFYESEMLDLKTYLNNNTDLLIENKSELLNLIKKIEEQS